MRISVLGIKRYCCQCKRSTWFHKRQPGESVCRGDYAPSMMRNFDAQELFPGCGVAVTKENYASNTTH